MNPPYLSRARLRRVGHAAALLPLLTPQRNTLGASHNLVWALFGDHAERQRDFLFRETGPGEFMLLSARPPTNGTGLFEIATPKPFEPKLRPGQTLQFDLRVNATVDVPGRDGKTRKVGVVSHALFGGNRGIDRESRAQEAALSWLARQGEKHGFELNRSHSHLVRWQTQAVDRKRDQKATLEILDIQGLLTVKEPEAFLRKVREGFGRSRGFGNGLMLVRRAS